MAKLKTTTCVNITAVTSNILPIGSIIKYHSATPPNTGWKLCNGALISKTTYSYLWENVLEEVHRFGAGDANNFNIPNLQDKFTRGANATTVNQSGGNLLHNHSIPSHNHTMSHNHVISHGHTTSSHNHTISHTHNIGSHIHSTDHSHTQSHGHTVVLIATSTVTIDTDASVNASRGTHGHTASSYLNTTSLTSTSGGYTGLNNNTPTGGSNQTYSAYNNVTVSLATSGIDSSASSQSNTSTSGITTTNDKVAVPYLATYYMIKVI